MTEEKTKDGYLEAVESVVIQHYEAANMVYVTQMGLEIPLEGRKDVVVRLESIDRGDASPEEAEKIFRSACRGFANTLRYLTNSATELEIPIMAIDDETGEKLKVGKSIYSLDRDRVVPPYPVLREDLILSSVKPEVSDGK